jgi:hypothetical protein
MERGVEVEAGAGAGVSSLAGVLATGAADDDDDDDDDDELDDVMV